jgi:hypothetical protein
MRLFTAIVEFEIVFQVVFPQVFAFMVLELVHPFRDLPLIVGLRELILFHSFCIVAKTVKDL